MVPACFSVYIWRLHHSNSLSNKQIFPAYSYLYTMSRPFTSQREVGLSVSYNSILKEVDLSSDAILKEEQSLQIWNSTGNRLSETKQRNNRFPSYTEMIASVLLSDGSKTKTLQDIYIVMQDRYPFLEQRGRSWKNSVRHTLSFNECFLKVPRPDSGQRCNWTIHPKYMQRFSQGDFKTSRVLSNRKRAYEKQITECSKTRYFNNSLGYLDNNQLYAPDHRHHSNSECKECSHPYLLFQELQRTNIEQQLTSNHQNRLRHYPFYTEKNLTEYNQPVKHNYSCIDEFQSENFRVCVDFSKFCISLLNEGIPGH